LIRGNANTIDTANAKDNEKSQKANWWINELDSLGIKQKESNKNQELEDQTDYIKQKFIYDYKACYSER
jgi:catalase (peroxidase I)